MTCKNYFHNGAALAAFLFDGYHFLSQEKEDVGKTGRGEGASAET